MKIENKSESIGIEHCHLCGRMIIDLYKYYKDDKPICSNCLVEVIQKLEEELK